MNMQHTPGPWEWDGNVCDYDPEQEAPWLVGADGCTPILSGQITATNPDSVRLIAAAPELLAALKDAISTIEGMSGQDMSCDPPMDVSDLRAAIAKATGSTA